MKRVPYVLVVLILEQPDLLNEFLYSVFLLKTFLTDMAFFHRTEFRRFFLRKFLELSAFNHNSSEKRNIFVHRLLKFSHFLV